MSNNQRVLSGISPPFVASGNLVLFVSANFSREANSKPLGA